MFELTASERRLLDHLEKQGGRAASLFQLCQQLDLDYHHTWQRVTILEMLGLLITRRSQGKPMIIELTAPIAAADDADSAV